MSGKKYDEGKQGFFDMPIELLKPLADVFKAGADKYGHFNCLKEFDDYHRRFYDAIVRHLEPVQHHPLAKDSELDVYHLAQVAANALMLLNCALKDGGRGRLNNLEPNPTAEPEGRRREQTCTKQELLERLNLLEPTWDEMAESEKERQ